MKTELRPEIVMPTGSDTTRYVAAAVGCALLGTGITMLVVVVPNRSAPTVVEPAVVTVPAPAVALPKPVTPALRASELGLVFRAGGASYVQLAELGSEDGGRASEPMPRHDEVQLVEDNDARLSAIGAVHAGDVPEAYRGWQGRTVVVDGSCRAKVTGFAVVARLVGDPGYAGLPDAPWTAETVLAHGTPMLGARLDGCVQGTFARDAALPAIVTFDEVPNAELASAATQLVIDSPAGKATQADWAENGGEGLWQAHSTVTAQVLKHPRTGAMWVSVHGLAEHECGGPSANVWGLFRVDPSGKLTTVQLRRLEDLESIEKIVDLEDDGELELIGRPWLGLDLVAVRAGGNELARLAIAYYGCPC